LCLVLAVMFFRRSDSGELPTEDVSED